MQQILKMVVEQGHALDELETEIQQLKSALVDLSSGQGDQTPLPSPSPHTPPPSPPPTYIIPFSTSISIIAFEPSDTTSPPSPPPTPPLSPMEPCPKLDEPSPIECFYILEPRDPLVGDLVVDAEENSDDDEIVYEDPPPPPCEQKGRGIMESPPLCVGATAGASSLVDFSMGPCKEGCVAVIPSQPLVELIPLGSRPFLLSRHEYAFLETDAQLQAICGESMTWEPKSLCFVHVKASCEVHHPSSLEVGFSWDAWSKGSSHSLRSKLRAKIHGFRNKERIVLHGAVRFLWDPGGGMESTPWWKLLDQFKHKPP